MEERPDEGTGEGADQPAPTPAEADEIAGEEMSETAADSDAAGPTMSAPTEPVALESTPVVRQAVTPSGREDLDSLVPQVFQDKFEQAQREEAERAALEAEAWAEHEARLEEEARLAEEARIAEEARAAEERAAAEAAAAESGEDPADQGGATDATTTTDAEAAALGDDMVSAPVSKGRVPWWPFLVYLVAWIALIATAALTISYETDAPPAFEQEYYAYVLLAGLVLTIAGPLLSLLVWFVVRYKTPKAERGGLFASSLIKGASVTIFGVIAWWGALVLLDAMRLGMVSGLS
jgi:hypothetical protein